MSRARRCRGLTLLLALALSLSGRSVLQGQSPRSVRYPLRLVDLTVVADTLYGFQLLAQPASRTVAEGTAGALVWLRFDPEKVLDWLNAAAAILRAAVPRGPDDAIQWSPTLRPLDGQGGLLLGRHRKKEKLEKERFLAVADSSPGWQAELSGQEADSVVRLFLALAPLARIDSSASVARDRAQVDRPARLAPPELRWPRGMRDRLPLQFVVGPDGQVEPESVQLLAPLQPPRHQAVVDWARALRFEPAQRDGRAVRQLVQLMIGPP